MASERFRATVTRSFPSVPSNVLAALTRFSWMVGSSGTVLHVGL
jgi:hypothetical protein